MKTLDDLLRLYALPSWRPVAWAVMIFSTIALIWANFAQLDQVSSAEGSVVPIGQVKSIQHLEGGIIIGMPVREGETVKSGDPLLLLELPSSSTNIEELQVRIDALILAKARLEAEAMNRPLEFPADVAQRRPNLVEAERSQDDARMKELNSTLSVLKEQVNQRQQNVREAESKARSISRNLEVLREKFSISKGLFEKGLSSRLEHLNIENEMQTLEGELSSMRESIPSAKGALAEAMNRVEEAVDAFRREAQDQLSQTELDLARNKELLSRADEQQSRTTIRSPIDGIVQNLRHHTIGGVVQPGEVVMELVPSEDRLIIEAKLAPIDRGYVRVGQDAVVKISTYDYALFGGLSGKVSLVAPDATVTQDGQTFFRVQVETDKSWLGETEGQSPIKPGMQATVDIHTGTRSVMFYLLKPVLKMKQEAFRER